MKSSRPRKRLKSSIDEPVQKKRIRANARTKYYVPNNQDQFNQFVRDVFEANKNEIIIKNQSLEIPVEDILKCFEAFKEIKTCFLNPEEEGLDAYILNVFIEVFSERILDAIRDEKISVEHVLAKDQAFRDKAAQAFCNYVPSKSKNPAISEAKDFCSIATTNSGNAVTDYYMQKEMFKTIKRSKNESMLNIWESNTLLKNTIQTALKNFLTKQITNKRKENNKNKFTGKKITVCMRRRSLVSHFRASTVIDVYQYLAKEGMIDLDKKLRMFDSSIGWLDRLFGTLMCANGKEKAFKSYTGFDPNPKVIKGAKRLFDDFQPKYNPDFEMTTYQQGIETATVEEILEKNSGQHFDIALTSPPFFKNPEKYGLGGKNENAQVWKRYKTESQYAGFLTTLMRINYLLLTAGGMFILHIKEKKLVYDAVSRINNSLGIDIQIKEGRYYPSLRTTDKEGETVFFIRRENENVRVPRLLKEKVEEDSNQSQASGSKRRR